MAVPLTRARPRALMIAPAMPAEEGNGLAMRQGLFLEGLSQTADVDLVVLPVAGRVAGPSPLVERLGVRTAIIPCSRPDTHFALLTQLKDPQARVDAFARYGRPQLSAALSVPVLQDLQSATAGRSYDFVHVGRAYLAPAAQPWIGSGAALSLDLDEDDCETSNSVACLYAHRRCAEAAAWAKAEAVAYDRLIAEVTPWFDRIWISSALDRNSLKSRHALIEPVVVPNAAPNLKSRARRDNDATLIFVGSFGYVPNVDAVQWFTLTAWPSLRARVPGLRFIVVGRDPPAEILALQGRPGVTVTGAVADLTAIYARASLALVPLRAGGGTRIKLLEALSQGVAVVATQTGAAGLPVAQSCCGWIADGAERFAAACRAALGDAAERRRRGARGRALVHRHYSRSRVLAGLACSLPFPRLNAPSGNGNASS
jgi:polysaccharide biosynthesis protein PslH